MFEDVNTFLPNIPTTSITVHFTTATVILEPLGYKFKDVSSLHGEEGWKPKSEILGRIFVS